MEKTNKYYSVIENLVKQNRKYSGLEAIIEDIIDDVYSHSEVIINSINNDSVIQSYLQKVVSTSIITVPKKMGFHPEIKHRTIDAQQVIENVVQKTAEKVNTALVDKMINNITVENNDTQQETVENAPESIELELDTPISIEEPIEQVSDDSSIDEEPEVLVETQDNDLEELIAPETLTVEGADEVEPIEEIEENVVPDTSLEASELNEEGEIENTVEETPVNSQEETLELADLEENPVDNTIEPVNETQDFEILETQELEPVDDNDVTTATTAEEPIEEPIFNNDVNNEVVTLEPSEELSESTLELDDLTPANEEFETQEPAETLDLDFQEDSLVANAESLEESPLDVISDSGLEQIADVVTTTLETPENAPQKELDFTPTDYSVFSYSTDKYKDDIDAEEIINDIKDLASKHPELNIISVYNLKFKDKLTIPQVASELNMSEDNVIEALNELVAIVQ